MAEPADPAADAPRVAVVGVGLIGGSIALAARRAGARVVGWDPRAGAADRVCDELAGSLAQAVAGADIAIVAAPVEALIATTSEVLAGAGEETVVTDVGSVKQAVVHAIRDARFIGGHPMAGAETVGVEHARPGLFEGATWYLTPTPATEGVRLERLTRFLTSIGARPQAIDPAAHDRLMAAVSHLPHVLANILVEGAVDHPLSGGPSFRDATRVAGANPDLWRSIYVANGDALIEEIDRAVERLGVVRHLIECGAVDALRDWQHAAAGQRARLDRALTGETTEEIRVVVPNRPGVIAELALRLGEQGINIHDMSLAPSADRSEGEVAIWVAAENAPRARSLIEEVAAG